MKHEEQGAFLRCSHSEAGGVVHILRTHLSTHHRGHGTKWEWAWALTNKSLLHLVYPKFLTF